MACHSDPYPPILRASLPLKSAGRTPRRPR
jgi:hypothetical protein